MKKLTALLIMLLLMPGAAQSVAFAADPSLIEDIQLILSPANNPNRLEVIFNLSESIDLSQENANIIIEYLGDNLQTTNYIKDKSWSGYLNSYENYPTGEQKYSSGYTNENYPNLVPAAKIYTSTKTGGKIDVAKVTAAKITVLRADGSGEQIIAGINGDILGIEEIAPTISEEVENPSYETPPPAIEPSLGIIIDSGTAMLPANTILVAEELSSGTVYNAVRLLMADAINFIAIDIKLESTGQTVQPDGKVKISIPIPEGFDNSNLAVYRVDADGSKIPYDVITTSIGGTEYATFLTDHFSTYVLVEERKTPAQNETAQITEKKTNRRESNDDSIQNKIAENTTQENIKKENKPSEKIEIEENKIPQTGLAQTQNYIIAIISIIGLLAFINIKKTNPANQKQSQD